MTHLEAWQDLWGLYCECFRESFGQHDIVLSPIVLEEFAIRIEKAAREDERKKVAQPEEVSPTARQLLFVYEAILTEMRTHATVDRQIAEWVKRLDDARDEAVRDGFDVDGLSTPQREPS